MTVQAPDGTLLLANEAAARMLGMSSVAELVAASPAHLTARFELLDEDGEPGRVLSTSPWSRPKKR